MGDPSGAPHRLVDLQWSFGVSQHLCSASWPTGLRSASIESASLLEQVTASNQHLSQVGSSYVQLRLTLEACDQKSDPVHSAAGRTPKTFTQLVGTGPVRATTQSGTAESFRIAVSRAYATSVLLHAGRPATGECRAAGLSPAPTGRGGRGKAAL
eukprot:scaffold4744_cov426-Prasinococcus_capsulatus_cf.AAC.4